MNYREFAEIEFPAVKNNGSYYTLDLKQEVLMPTYIKHFDQRVVDLYATGFEADVIGWQPSELPCSAEAWIIRNNYKINDRNNTN